METDISRLTNASSSTTSTPQSLISDGITLSVHAQFPRPPPGTDTPCSTSPSVYVAYRNLRASDIYPSFDNGDLTRVRAYNTTIAYQPSVLSTSICTGEPEGFYQGFSAINITALQHSTRYNDTCLDLNISMETTTNGPYLSLPQDLTIVDPA